MKAAIKIYEIRNVKLESIWVNCITAIMYPRLIFNWT